MSLGDLIGMLAGGIASALKDSVDAVGADEVSPILITSTAVSEMLDSVIEVQKASQGTNVGKMSLTVAWLNPEAAKLFEGDNATFNAFIEANGTDSYDVATYVFAGDDLIEEMTKIIGGCAENDRLVVLSIFSVAKIDGGQFDVMATAVDKDGQASSRFASTNLEADEEEAAELAKFLTSLGGAFWKSFMQIMIMARVKDVLGEMVSRHIAGNDDPTPSAVNQSENGDDWEGFLDFLNKG